MIELKGKYNTAKVYNDNVEGEAVSQIIRLLNQEFVAGSKIRIMPDAHAGAGCTIGTTMTIEDKAVPNLVGVDIGCGMETTVIKADNVGLQDLDKVIREYVPSGMSVREKAHPFIKQIELEKLCCVKQLSLSRAVLSMGTLGGGNHFIELGKDESGRIYLVIHSGSRYLGKQVAEYYQEAAYKDLYKNSTLVKEVIEKLKAEGRQQEIQAELKKVQVVYEKDLAYVRGQLFDDYIHDMGIVQKYAELNRKAMAAEIVKHMKFKVDEVFTTTHNYIDLKKKILRKGAISAEAGEKILIPMNMRDGSLVCLGKGNEDWNCSAPHGAGRLMSRSKAKANITLEQFQKSMEGIYSTSVTQSTIDESPFAYKPMDEIVDNIGETAEIINIVKPLYNFKASEEYPTDYRR